MFWPTFSDMKKVRCLSRHEAGFPAGEPTEGYSIISGLYIGRYRLICFRSTEKRVAIRVSEAIKGCIRVLLRERCVFSEGEV